MSIYGFILGICFVIGMEFFSRRNKIIPKNKETLFLISLLFFSLIGARVYEVADNWKYYLQFPLEIFNTRAGGLGIYGGLLFGIIFLFIYSKINKISLFKITDLLVPIISLGQSIGRFGNFSNTEVFGIPTYLKFGQFIPENLRPLQYQNYSFFHPVWLYESILDFVLFLILIKSKNNQTAKYIIGYGLIRFFTEFLRWDTWNLYGFKMAQIISLAFIVTGIILIKLKKLNLNYPFSRIK